MKPTHDKCLWILEDDPGCKFVYEQTLDHRFQTKYFDRIDEFFASLGKCRAEQGRMPSLVIADLMLNDGNFLNNRTNSVGEIHKLPFIIVSSIDDIDALRFCFKEGALDYLTKPFKKNELLVKIENALAGSHRTRTLQEVPATRAIEIDGVQILELTAKQAQLVNLFLSNEQRSISRQQILEKVWGDTNVHPKTVDVHLYNLRRKLNAYGFMIRSDGGGRWSLLPDRYDFNQTTNFES
jgi:DNA-binding response OmpR family regulator